MNIPIGITLLFLVLLFLATKAGKGIKAMAGSFLILITVVTLVEFGIGLVIMGVSTESGRASFIALGAVILIVALIYFMLDMALSIIYFMLDEEGRRAFGGILYWKSWNVKEK